MKIVYCLNSICYLGGIERVTIVKANALAEMPGNEVFLIVTDNKRDYKVNALSPKVNLVDLHVNYFDDDWKAWYIALKSSIVKRRQHKRRLTKALFEIQPDIVVSVGQSEKYFLPTIRGKWKTIREIHFTSNYRLLFASNARQRLMARLANLYDFHRINKYDKTVILTREDKEAKWKYNKKVMVIPNPITIPNTEEKSFLASKKIVVAGRLTEQKNFSSVIRSFKMVVLKHPDWSLDIYGEGPLKEQLQNLISNIGLERNVFLRGYTSQVREKMLEASCYVLSSLYEGFPLVLLEAMSCGLPVVSYACPCGPKDLVEEGRNGFLVPVCDERALADRICLIIEDENLRKSMGLAAKQTSEKYKLEIIMQMWMDLFKKLLM